MFFYLNKKKIIIFNYDFAGKKIKNIPLNCACLRFQQEIYGSLCKSIPAVRESLSIIGPIFDVLNLDENYYHTQHMSHFQNHGWFRKKQKINKKNQFCNIQREDLKKYERGEKEILKYI